MVAKEEEEAIKNNTQHPVPTATLEIAQREVSVFKRSLFIIVLPYSILYSLNKQLL